MTKDWKQEPFEEPYKSLFGSDPFEPKCKEPRYPNYFSVMSKYYSDFDLKSKKMQSAQCPFCEAGVFCLTHGIKEQSSLKQTPEKFGSYTAEIYKMFDKKLPSQRLVRLHRTLDGQYTVFTAMPGLSSYAAELLFSHPHHASFFTKPLTAQPIQIGGVHLVSDVRDIEVGNYEAPTGADAYEVLGKVESTPLSVPPLTGLEAVVFFEMK